MPEDSAVNDCKSQTGACTKAHIRSTTTISVVYIALMPIREVNLANDTSQADDPPKSTGASVFDGGPESTSVQVLLSKRYH